MVQPTFNDSYLAWTKWHHKVTSKRPAERNGQSGEEAARGGDVVPPLEEDAERRGRHFRDEQDHQLRDNHARAEQVHPLLQPDEPEDAAAPAVVGDLQGAVQRGCATDASTRG